MQDLGSQRNLKQSTLVDAVRQMFGATQIGRDRIDVDDAQIAPLGNVVEHEIEFLGCNA
jgi:hypothetical protein